MENNVIPFVSKQKNNNSRTFLDELGECPYIYHLELLSKLDRCLELSFILENDSDYPKEYKHIAAYIYHAFRLTEDI